VKAAAASANPEDVTEKEEEVEEEEEEEEEAVCEKGQKKTRESDIAAGIESVPSELEKSDGENVLCFGTKR
jgi:hypothetical protein